jgi:hypothetical protein
MSSKFTLQAGDKTFELNGYQSPRGLRNGSQRPTKVTLEVKEEFDLSGLRKHIDYLMTLSMAMEVQTTKNHDGIGYDGDLKFSM